MPATLLEIKTQMEKQVGNKITLTIQGSRNRQSERHGVLAELYPAVFVVDLDQEENAFERLSYSYADVLTGSIAIEFDETDEEQAV